MKLRLKSEDGNTRALDVEKMHAFWNVGWVDSMAEQHVIALGDFESSDFKRDGAYFELVDGSGQTHRISEVGARSAEELQLVAAAMDCAV